MLTSLATHSLIDIEASVKGDLMHHCVEDLAIGLGEALNKALGTRKAIHVLATQLHQWIAHWL
jgi:imidazoleglycerol-phosphate dehydratase